MADNTCQSEYCNAGWGEVLTHMSPYGYANFGIAFGLGLSVVGAAWGIWLTGSSLVGAAVKAPRIRSKNLIRCVASGWRGPQDSAGTRVRWVVTPRGSGRSSGGAPEGHPMVALSLNVPDGLTRCCDKFRQLPWKMEDMPERGTTYESRRPRLPTDRQQNTRNVAVGTVLPPSRRMHWRQPSRIESYKFFRPNSFFTLI